jgi:hypothetical protein
MLIIFSITLYASADGDCNSLLFIIVIMRAGTFHKITAALSAFQCFQFIFFISTHSILGLRYTLFFNTTAQLQEAPKSPGGLQNTTAKINSPHTAFKPSSGGFGGLLRNYEFIIFNMLHLTMTGEAYIFLSFYNNISF